MTIALTSIPVNDPIAAFRFYTEVLGFKEKLFMPEMMLAIVVSAEDPDGAALLLEPNNNPITKPYQEAVYAKNLPIIVLGSKDIQADYERLKGLGVVFRSEPKKTDWGTQAMFEDTFGNLIRIHQA